MVARGDMGVEIPWRRSPSLQKMLIQKGYNAGQTGDHRHPDAGLHDEKPPPHPGGDHRRGQRHLRRHQRHHALGRNRRRRVSGGIGARPWPASPTRTEEDIDYQKRFHCRDVNDAAQRDQRHLPRHRAPPPTTWGRRPSSPSPNPARPPG